MHISDRFLPAYCPDFVPVSLEAKMFDMRQVDERFPKKERRLEFAQWIMSWDNYSLAAAILKQVGARFVNVRYLFSHRCRWISKLPCFTNSELWR